MYLVMEVSFIGNGNVWCVRMETQITKHYSITKASNQTFLSSFQYCNGGDLAEYLHCEFATSCRS